jgi:transposase
MRGVKQVKESTGRGKKHRYGAEFKVTAVKMASRADIEVQAVAAALGIHPFMLSRWKKEYREGTLKGNAHPDLREVKRLEGAVAEEKQIRRLETALKKARVENDLLKKAIRFNLERRPSSSRS